jgi:hypothetical protein
VDESEASVDVESEDVSEDDDEGAVIVFVCADVVDDVVAGVVVSDGAERGKCKYIEERMDGARAEKGDAGEVAERNEEDVSAENETDDVDDEDVVAGRCACG